MNTNNKANINSSIDYTIKLYLVLHPNHSLIASQLNPSDFAKHFMLGSARYFEGNLIFAEVDPNFRNPYFRIDEILKEVVPHEDGRPKATKFISSYRVLEHIDLKALGKLYFSNIYGDIVEMESKNDDPVLRGDELRIILEINPIKMMVLTKLNIIEYGKFITDPNMPKGAPKMFYTQLEFNADEFLKQFDENPFLQYHIPGIHPVRLEKAIKEIRNTLYKKTKGLYFDCPIDKISYKNLRHGFMFASKDEIKFYPLLALDEIEKKYFKFWKNL